MSDIKVDKKTFENVCTRSHMQWNGKGIPIRSDVLNTLNLEIVFVEKSGEWTKCLLTYRYKPIYTDINDNMNIARVSAIAKLHPDDKWDPKMGREISFAKAMAKLLCLNRDKLFK